jgi:hypothetical protein
MKERIPGAGEKVYTDLMLSQIMDHFPPLGMCVFYNDNFLENQTLLDNIESFSRLGDVLEWTDI